MRLGSRARMVGLALVIGAGTTLALAQTAPPPTPAEAPPDVAAPSAAPAGPPGAPGGAPVTVTPETPVIPPTEPVKIAPVPEDEAPAASDAKPAAPKAPPPPKVGRYPAAIIQALDKVTAETLRFEAPLNQPIRYKGLIFTVHSCNVSTTDQTRQTAAHMQVDSQPIPLPGRPYTPPKTIYRGWMFAEAPALHPLEHSVYDAWLIACKTASPPLKGAKR
ncbi:MAG: DUF2155 domain-containing protein [Caulobacteraceae bacterium]